MKEYLGDSVYAEYDKTTDHIKLTINNGDRILSIIYLNSYVQSKLIHFIKLVEKENGK